MALGMVNQSETSRFRIKKQSGFFPGEEDEKVYFEVWDGDKLAINKIFSCISLAVSWIAFESDEKSDTLPRKKP
jgi:hypothetical protein